MKSIKLSLYKVYKRKLLNRFIVSFSTFKSSVSLGNGGLLLGEIIMNMTPWHSIRNFDDFFSGLNQSIAKRPAQEGMLSADWLPSVDITENQESFMIKAELPEVNKEDVKVSIDKNILTLSGERRAEKVDEKEHRIERSYGSFSRSFSLPDNIDEENIRAESKNGMLYLTLPKGSPKEKLTQIEIH